MSTPGSHRGRPKGRKDGPHVDPEKRRAVAYRNACGGRVFVSKDMREELGLLKNKLARALTTDGVKWLVQIIAEGPPHWERDTASGEKRLVDGSAQFEWAMNFAADRAGLPRLAQVDHSGVSGFTITVTDTRGELGWPEPAARGDARDDSGEHPGAVN